MTFTHAGLKHHPLWNHPESANVSGGWVHPERLSLHPVQSHTQLCGSLPGPPLGSGPLLSLGVHVASNDSREFVLWHGTGVQNDASLFPAPLRTVQSHSTFLPVLPTAGHSGRTQGRPDFRPTIPPACSMSVSNQELRKAQSRVGGSKAVCL